MSSPVRVVPEALVLVPLLAVSLAVMLWHLNSTGRFSWPRAVAGAAACCYGVGVLKEVLQPFQIGFGERYDLSWRAFVHLTPLAGAEPGDVLDNVVLFLPLGVFLALLARVRSARRVTLTGFVLSLSIETTQLVLDVTVSTGRVADVNDLLGNTIGAAAGYALLRLCGCVAPLARLNTAMTWPAPAGAPESAGPGHQRPRRAGKPDRGPHRARHPAAYLAHRVLASLPGRSSVRPGSAAPPDQGDRGNARRERLDHHPSPLTSCAALSAWSAPNAAYCPPAARVGPLTRNRKPDSRPGPG